MGFSLRAWLARFSPLGWRLVAFTVAFSTLVALIATAVQLYIDYRYDIGKIDSTFEQVKQSYLPTIANAMWATNRKELQLAVDGLARLPDVQHVTARDTTTVSVQAGTPKAGNVLSRDYPLTHQHRDSMLEIGSLTVTADLDGVYQRLLGKFWVIFITNGVKTFLVAGFMLVMFHLLVTRHLHRIAEFSARLGAGNLDEHLQLDRPARARLDEFDLVLNGFSRMQTALALTLKELEEDIVKLEMAEAEITQLNLDLERRVSERTAQLEAVNRELESFSYSVSHDLRTPLRSIDGFSQALAEDYGQHLDETGHDYLNRVRRAAQRMGMLIDDLLRLARVTRVDMVCSQVDLSAMAHEVVTDLRGHKSYGAATFVIEPGLVAWGAAPLLRIVLENLIDNAWKYSSKVAAAQIEFGATQQDGRTVYFVRDNGAGFDMTYVDKLFGAFQRLHRADEFPGTGVGLATVQRIIHRHQGEVRAEGRIAEGAAFYFTLGNAGFRTDQETAA
jgi:signal transduction histidine kinase